MKHLRNEETWSYFDFYLEKTKKNKDLQVVCSYNKINKAKGQKNQLILINVLYQQIDWTWHMNWLNERNYCRCSLLKYGHEFVDTHVLIEVIWGLVVKFKCFFGVDVAALTQVLISTSLSMMLDAVLKTGGRGE